MQDHVFNQTKQDQKALAEAFQNFADSLVGIKVPANRASIRRLAKCVESGDWERAHNLAVESKDKFNGPGLNKYRNNWVALVRELDSQSLKDVLAHLPRHKQGAPICG
jgi:hypothetical protein